MKIWEALKVWFVKVFGTAIISWLAYRKGKNKFKDEMEANYIKNQEMKKKIKENLKNSPKYKRLFDKMKLLVLLLVVPCCMTSPDYNKNYCDLYEPIKYAEGDVSNLLTEYQIELNNTVYKEICK